MTLTCPHCFYVNPQGALVCEQCYAALDTLLRCGNCGTLVPNQATFCSHCGFPLSLNSNPQPQPGSVPAASPRPMAPPQ